jgi:hypothetical protein
MTDALSCFMRELISSSDNYSSHMLIIIDNAKTIQAPPSTKKLRTPQRSVSSPLHPTSRWDPFIARTTTLKSCHSNPIASTSSSESSSTNSPLLMMDHPSLVSTETSRPGERRASSWSRLLLRQPVRRASLKEEDTTSVIKALRLALVPPSLRISLPLGIVVTPVNGVKEEETPSCTNN